jgi:hypothetical protein
MRRIAGALLLLGVVAAGAVGFAVWGTSQSPGSVSPKTGLRVTRSVPCLEAPTPVNAETLKRLAAVAAVDCEWRSKKYPGQGQWGILIRKVAVRGVAAWQRYYEQPDETHGTGACTLDLVWFPRWGPAFVDASGHWMVPRTPLDICKKPIGWPNGTKPAPIGWRTVSVRKLKLEISARALTAHCGLNWGAKLPIGMSNPGSTRIFAVAPNTVRVCVYRTAGSVHRIVGFVRALTLDQSHAAQLLAALDRTGPTTNCRASHTVAVVFMGQGLSAPNVELGGCFRIARNMTRRWVGRADPEVIRSLLRSR